MNSEYENLREAMSLLKKKREIEKKLLKEQAHVVLESIKPVNLIKGLVKDITSPEIKGNVTDTLIGMGTGYLSKLLFVGGSSNLFKKGLGALLQTGITNVATHNSDRIKSAAENVVQFFLNKFSKKKTVGETF